MEKKGYGHYEFLAKLNGLINAPYVFKLLLIKFQENILTKYTNRDRILIFSSSENEHIQHVQQVLKKFLENKLFVKLEKCKFH